MKLISKETVRNESVTQEKVQQEKAIIMMSGAPLTTLGRSSITVEPEEGEKELTCLVPEKLRYENMIILSKSINILSSSQTNGNTTEKERIKSS